MSKVSCNGGLATAPLLVLRYQTITQKNTLIT